MDLLAAAGSVALCAARSAATVAVAAAMALLLSVVGCVPELDDRSSIVSAPRLLAVRADPAEATPGSAVRWSALWADPAGGSDSPPLDWALCRDPVALSELAPVSPRCLTLAASWLDPLGSGATVEGAIPGDACRLFGPTPPDQPAGQPAARPVDPDTTGGYYQPLRILEGLASGVAWATFRSRVQCGVAGAPREEAVEWSRRYRPNTNPSSPSLALVIGADPQPLAPESAGAPIAIAPGRHLTLRASWPDCPAVGVCSDAICGDDESATDCPADCLRPAGCGGAEYYVLYDPLGRQVVRRREALRVSWLASGGRFDDQRTEVSGNETAARSDNGWTAPSAPGEARLWVILRDDRGGVGWQSWRFLVTP